VSHPTSKYSPSFLSDYFFVCGRQLEAHDRSCIPQLLVIEGLTTSGVDEYTEAANVILNKLYYDADTLDMVIKLMSKYTNQSLKYLENIVHFSFVFLKMLERYAGRTDYMYVRKKKSRKSKQRQPSKSEDQLEGALEETEPRKAIDDEEQAFDEAEQSNVQFAEHKFEFGKFQAVSPACFARFALIWSNNDFFALALLESPI
jgi:replication fork protection complex subunit Tof1/Swi1